MAEDGVVGGRAEATRPRSTATARPGQPNSQGLGNTQSNATCTRAVGKRDAPPQWPGLGIAPHCECTLSAVGGGRTGFLAFFFCRIF